MEKRNRKTFNEITYVVVDENTNRSLGSFRYFKVAERFARKHLNAVVKAVKFDENNTYRGSTDSSNSQSI